jgi:EmrB/QacA subfamily drug resistance transporter
VVAIGVLMANLDLTVVNVALPVMNRDLPGSTLASVSWTLNAYAIVYAAVLVPAGRLADRNGRARVFLAGMVTFTLASVLCAAAPGVWFLVGARVVQAAGAAAMVPTSLGLLIGFFPHRRAAAVRGWTAAGALAGAFGPAVGGLLVELDWRWVFLVNVPIGVATVVLGRLVLPAHRRVPDEPLPDLLGSAVLVIGVAAITLAIARSGEWGWASARTLGCLVGGVLLLVYLLRRSARHPSPILSPPLLRIRSFAVANVVALLYSVSFAAAILSVSLWCQDVWGWSPVLTGLALMPGNLLLVATSMAGGPVVRRLGGTATIVLGCVLMAAGGLWWATRAGLPVRYLAVLLPGLLVTRLGMGLALPALVGAATTDLPPAALATGSAINAMVRQVGNALGFALAVLAIGSATAPGALVRGFHAGWVLLAAAAVAAALTALALAALTRGPSPTATSPAP